MKQEERIEEVTRALLVREKENVELREMLAGAQLTEKNLKDYLFDICDIIHYQEPLKIQDRWLNRMIELGIYKPELEE